MIDKALKNDCYTLAQVQYQRARRIQDDEIRERSIKAWAHIIELIETSY